MITQFDKLLKAAFDAGAERGVMEYACEQGFPPPPVAPLTYNEWRASVAGLDLSDDKIRIGDRVRVLPSWGVPFEKYYLAEGEVHSITEDLAHFHVDHGPEVTLAVPVQHLGRIR